MLRLLSLSLTNIGPFRDQIRTVEFHSGSYLIKAPIGSGKSFLYFDGPTFALYKKNKIKNGRDMLNMYCKTGQIICTFEVEEQIYTIQRNFSRTPTGESVKSKLFSNEILLDFKNEKDIQDNLASLLPPFEVFLGTQMLMQDSDNIFEMDPKDRLEIFKNVFNLIGIDEAKEKINEQKREVSAMIKARADISQYNEKITIIIDNLIDNRTTIEQLEKDYHLPTQHQRVTTIDERSLLRGKLTVDQLSIPEARDNNLLLSTIDTSSEQLIVFQSQEQSLRQQYNIIQQEQQKLQSNLTETNLQLI